MQRNMSYLIKMVLTMVLAENLYDIIFVIQGRSNKKNIEQINVTEYV